MIRQARPHSGLQEFAGYYALVREFLELSEDGNDEDAVLEVATPLGANTVVVEGGSVRMDAADCPHGDCLRQRPITRPGEQIICLPHELWIEIVPEDGESSGMLDEDAVSYPDDVDTVAG